MLTIGQLADYTGVTVRAIRHYHQRGLLPEPPRDQSGYRRYDSRAVITVTHIKTLTQAGVPLAAVPRLLEAGPDELRGALPDLDAALTRRIAELEDTRLRLRALGSGERDFLTADVAAHLARLADLGLDAEQIAIERDMWSLLLALYPRHVHAWLERTTRLLDDEEIAQLYIDIHGARQLSADDPRISRIARRAADLARRNTPSRTAAPDMKRDRDALRLVVEHGLGLSPAWLRLMELGRQDMRTD